MIEERTALLLESQNSDGGWGTAKGKRSSTEATSLAVMALELSKQESYAAHVQRGVTWLIQHQGADGSWPVSVALKEGSWSTALAIIALSSSSGYQDNAAKGAEWLLIHRGSGLPWLASLLVRLSVTKLEAGLNPNLKGWSWTSNTFSWVEPTAYSLIALKKIKSHLNTSKVLERVGEAERMLYDRMCKGGGWNHGSPNVLGESSWPYPDITALALIALQDHAEAEANQQSVRALQKMLEDVHSGLALSWSIICLSLYGQDTAKWKELLVKSFEKTQFLGETKTIALSLLALGNGANFFKI